MNSQKPSFEIRSLHGVVRGLVGAFVFTCALMSVGCRVQPTGGAPLQPSGLISVVDEASKTQEDNAAAKFIVYIHELDANTPNHAKLVKDTAALAAVGLLDADKHINKNVPLRQEPEPDIEESRSVRQATWNQPEPDSEHEFDRMLATKRLPLMDHDEDMDDVTQQINEIKEKIRVRQENLEKRLESTRQQESAAIAKREELARLQEVARRLELAEREELATRPKLAKREDIVKRLELAERKNLVKRDEAGKSDPMASITKLIEENKRIKKRTSQPAQ